MKYSVLLPTRNGGKFLRHCIESILSQDYDDFELFISDNANSDETPAIIAGYASHPQVRAIRLDEPVSVTDNWNAAYRASSGDYILMMGDDDYLLPGYFERADALLEKYDRPDCILYNGYSFIAPDSIAGDRRSYYSHYHFPFGPGFESEHELREEERLNVVRGMFRWASQIPLNMQTTLVARQAAERIEGGFFQPPFPDHYALNAMLVMGCRWVFTPERMVVVGISPKSFGHFVYSGKQESGLAYLGIDPTFPGELPGNPLLNGMHVWLDRLLDRFPKQLQGVEIDRAGYVRRQVYHWLLQRRFGALSWRDLARRFGLLSAADWSRLALTWLDPESWRRLRSIVAPSADRVGTQLTRQQPLEGVPDIAAFARFIAKTKDA